MSGRVIERPTRSLYRLPYVLNQELGVFEVPKPHTIHDPRQPPSQVKMHAVPLQYPGYPRLACYMNPSNLIFLFSILPNSTLFTMP